MMQLSFQFPADPAVLEKIGEITGSTAQCAGFNDINISDIQLAVDEACTNTIFHGLKKDPARHFRLILKWKPRSIEILIYEDGEPFDLTKVPEPVQGQVGGWGIYIIRKLMDKVEYQIDENGIKTVRMVKKMKRET